MVDEVLFFLNSFLKYLLTKFILNIKLIFKIQNFNPKFAMEVLNYF